MNSKKEIINLKPSNITIGNKLKKQTDKENTLNTIIHLFKLYLIPVVTDILSIPPPDPVNLLQHWSRPLMYP